MSTIGSLLALADPNIKPWYEGQQGVNREQLGRQQAQTGLIELQRLKESQAAEQAVLLAVKNNPALAQQLLGGGPVLGSLGTAGGMPGAAPMTQQAFGPGGAPGPAQMVPGGQDLSRFATQGAPQSTIASLGPAGQPGMQPQQNPVLEMAATNPRAAMMLQQQLEGRQDAAMKRQGQQLEMGAKVLGYVGQQAQGVTDQASLDALRSDLQSQGLGKYAAQLPQLYSKGAMEPFIAKALDVKDALTLQIAEQKARADQIRAGLAGRTDAVNTELEIMGLAPASVSARAQQGDPQAKAQLAEATNRAEQRQIRISALQGTGQIVKGPTGEYIRTKPGTDQVEVIKGPGGEPLREKPSEAEQKGATLANSVAAANKLATELEDKGYKPSVWDKGMDKLPLGLGNYVTSSDYQQYRQTVREFASAWLYGVSGAQITESEWENANLTFFPQPNEDKAAVALKRERRAALVKQLEQQTAATGRTGTQAQPQSQGSTGTGPATFDRADFLKWRQGSGKSGNPTQADVEAYFQAKGLKRR
jgi:hypothetical protein